MNNNLSLILFIALAPEVPNAALASSSSSSSSSSASASSSSCVNGISESIRNIFSSFNTKSDKSALDLSKSSGHENYSSANKKPNSNTSTNTNSNTNKPKYDVYDLTGDD